MVWESKFKNSPLGPAYVKFWAFWFNLEAVWDYEMCVTWGWGFLSHSES